MKFIRIKKTIQIFRQMTVESNVLFAMIWNRFLFLKQDLFVDIWFVQGENQYSMLLIDYFVTYKPVKWFEDKRLLCFDWPTSHLEYLYNLFYIKIWNGVICYLMKNFLSVVYCTLILISVHIVDEKRILYNYYWIKLINLSKLRLT